MRSSILARPEVDLPSLWWLDLEYRGGVEKRVGWEDLEIFWYVVCFKDGTRGPVVYATHNDPSGWKEIA